MSKMWSIFQNEKMVSERRVQVGKCTKFHHKLQCHDTVKMHMCLLIWHVAKHISGCNKCLQSDSFLCHYKLSLQGVAFHNVVGLHFLLSLSYCVLTKAHGNVISNIAGDMDGITADTTFCRCRVSVCLCVSGLCSSWARLLVSLVYTLFHCVC